MNRLGFAPAAYRAAWLRLDALPQVDEITLMTHLADADAADARRSTPRSRPSTRRPRDLPGRALALQQRRAPCAIGADASPRRRRLGAAGHPALRLVARPPAAHAPPTGGLRAGDDAARAADRGAGRSRPATASATAAASPPSADCAIGVVACGYADGYPRLAPGRTSAARRCWSTACARAPSAGSRWT